MKKQFNVSSYANMMKPGTMSMEELVKLQLSMKEHVDAIVDAPTKDEVEAALEELKGMSKNDEPDPPEDSDQDL